MISMASSGQKSSNFTQTCNLLSQYLKEKGNFGDFSRGIASKPEGVEFETSRPQSATTMNLLPNLENVGVSSSSSVKAADFFNNKAEATVETEKAKEIMALATKSGSSVNTTFHAHHFRFPDKKKGVSPQILRKKKGQGGGESTISNKWGASVAPAKPEESREKPWLLELEAQSFKQLDLNL
ncbi:hypothetical protein Patl1_33724 [Pistacia atlantica]|uniref:Uncharacterized protein n=1 Tax=Pistacia atlantica TaxID=434234 RepID=A0ACC0ZRB2_9ROSI|nr:hypothetical protein Patl1_33724 [Pistacia atlantica]